LYVILLCLYLIIRRKDMQGSVDLYLLCQSGRYFISRKQNIQCWSWYRLVAIIANL